MPNKRKWCCFLFGGCFVERKKWNIVFFNERLMEWLYNSHTQREKQDTEWEEDTCTCAHTHINFIPITISVNVSFITGKIIDDIQLKHLFFFSFGDSSMFVALLWNCITHCFSHREVHKTFHNLSLTTKSKRIMKKRKRMYVE